MGFTFLLIKCDAITAEIYKVNETKIVPSEIKSFESTTGVEIWTTTVKSSTIVPNVTKVFEVTTSTHLPSTATESLTTFEYDDFYDEDVTEVSNTTEANKIKEITINSTTIPTVNHTQVAESTTEAIVTTTIATTTETTTFRANLSTTTIASIPKNESRPASNETDSNGILSAQIVTDLYTYYKMIAPIILRIIFGIIVSVTKVKDALKKPTGIAISLFCNFFYMPLVRYWYKLHCFQIC